MTIYSKTDLDSEAFFNAELGIKYLVNKIDCLGVQYLVYEFHKAPKELQKLCNLNGGDEDWMVISKEKPEDNWTPRWLEKTDSCDEPDEYHFDNCFIYVGNHG